MLKKTPLKKSSTPLKRTAPLKSNGKGLSRGKSLRAKPKTKEQVEEQREQHEKDLAFYTEIWETRPHYCEECGVYLGGEMKPLFMDHLIEKSSHNELRYETENIFLCCGDHHAQKTNGFPGKKHLEAINKAKQKFLK